MLWKKLSEKSAKNVFLYSHEYRVQKMGVGKREIIFPETHEYCEQKMLGKKSSERSEKTFCLYSHEYRYQKMEGKTRETIFPETHE